MNHLGHHLKNRETVQCPFLRCTFKTNTHSTFSSNKSWNQKYCLPKDFRTVQTTVTDENIICEQIESETATSAREIVRFNEVEDIGADVDSDTLEHKFDSLFSSMQTVLHVSRSATQNIAENLQNLLSFSNIQTFNSVKEILSKHKMYVNDCVLLEISSAVVLTNPLLSTISEKRSLSTDHRRNKYFKECFPACYRTHRISVHHSPQKLFCINRYYVGKF